MNNQLIERLIEYASRFRPEFADVIQGASKREIQEFESQVGRALPNSYKTFLGRFGHNDGDLGIAFDGTTDIKNISDFYARFVNTEAVTLPPDCIMIGRGGVEIEKVCLHDSGQVEPTVVLTDGLRIGNLYSENLEKLLFRKVFLKFHCKSLPASGYWATAESAPLINKGSDLMIQMGFKQMNFSDTVTWCGSRDGTLVWLNQYQDEGVGLFIADETPQIVREVGSRIEHELQLQRKK